jgi:hypothetical protein
VAGYHKRVAALTALVAGSRVLGAVLGVVSAEFREVVRVKRVGSIMRRRLLQVLHSTRALDTALAEFTAGHHCQGRARSLNQYLKELTRHSSASLRRQLTISEHGRFKASIANIRNQYMHRAGTFPPTDAEVASLLVEMDDCLALVIALE